MKVERKAVHKLTVGLDCGCTGIAEYSDEAMKAPITLEPRIAHCAEHEVQDGVKTVLASVLVQAVKHEASMTKVPEPPRELSRHAGPEPVTGGEQGAQRVRSLPVRRIQDGQRSAPQAAGEETPPTSEAQPKTTVASAPQTQGQQVTRTPIPTNRPRIASAGTRPSGSSPIRRVDPMAGTRAAAVSSKVAAAAPMQIDMDSEVPEDPRLTNLVDEVSDEEDGEDYSKFA